MAQAETQVKGIFVQNEAERVALRLPGVSETSQAGDGVERRGFEWALPRLARGLERTRAGCTGPGSAGWEQTAWAAPRV